jgi:hypothetical protein
MQGMVNCYGVCHASFEETMDMVGSARGLKPEEVKGLLRRIKETSRVEYDSFRSKLPDEFPM